MLTIQDFERRFRNYIPGPQDVSAAYAVLVPLVERDGTLHLLFEVRADTLKRQPNEVCFPGGRMEEGETAEVCALRETAEELGIPSSAIRVIGPLDYIAHYSGMMIYPVLARVEARSLEGMVLSSREVMDTFLAPLSFFTEHPPKLHFYELNPRAKDNFPYEYVGFEEPYPFRSGEMIVPVYEKYGQYAVWGITGRIVRWLTRSINNII